MNFDKVPRAKLPTPLGDFIIYGFRDCDSGEEAVALVVGNPSSDSVALVRIHSQCLTGDVFSSGRCDCGDQLKLSIKGLQEMGGGLVLYLAQEGRGLGLANKMRTYQMQDEGLDTVDANWRSPLADQIGARIVQLGGEPNLNPEGLLTRSHAEYVEGDTLQDMIREDLVAERIAIAVGLQGV